MPQITSTYVRFSMGRERIRRYEKSKQHTIQAYSRSMYGKFIMWGKCTLDPPHFWQKRLVTEIPLSTNAYSMYVGARLSGRRMKGSRSVDLDLPI